MTATNAKTATGSKVNVWIYEYIAAQWGASQTRAAAREKCFGADWLKLYHKAMWAARRARKQA